MISSKLLAVTLGLVLTVGAITPAYAVVGSFFLTGHDPDFHATLGPSTTGARNIINAAIDFTTDPAFNPFSNAGVNKFLFVESNIAVPSGHTNGVNGIVAAGHVLNTDFEHHDATTLDGELDQLGTKYAAIVVASDCGGILTQSELDILNTRSGDIITFLNNGGGIVAFSEGNSCSGITPNGGHYGFLPFVVSSNMFNQGEGGITVTPFGASLGLVDSDVNSNFSHNIFVGTFGLEIVDDDQLDQILSIAGRGKIIDGGVDPNPETPVVGGEFLPIETTSLMLAGLQSSAIWMLPVLAGAAGAGFAAFKLRRK